MASAKETEVSVWLQNKLGSVDDLWSSSSICGQLNKEKLLSIQECFSALQPHVKVKLLLSFLHIPKRNVEEWQQELEHLLEEAETDLDQWVSVTASLLRNFPSGGTVSVEPTVIQETLAQLKKAARKSQDTTLVPIECSYVGKTVLSSVIGAQSPAIRNFSLKRKPKSATLRIELLNKSSEVSNHSRKSGGGHSYPVKFRSSAKKLENDKPYTSLSGQTMGFFKSTSFARSFGGNTSQRVHSVQREGGIKLLDFSEMPLQGREAKRRRKQAEAEARIKEEEALEVMPDYAAGLLPQLNAQTAAMTAATPGPTYVPPASTTIQLHTNKLEPDPPAIFVNPSALSGALTMGIANPNITITGLAPAAAVPFTIQHLPSQNNPQSLVTMNQQVSIVQQQQHASSQPTLVQISQARKNLTLTREQMAEAQTLFGVSNKVTRPEKALILGFMAGSRDNPCPHQGDLVNIRLSENEESVEQPDGTFRPMAVETYFQMNYATGEWRKIRKYREMMVDL